MGQLKVGDWWQLEVSGWAAASVAICLWRHACRGSGFRVWGLGFGGVEDAVVGRHPPLPPPINSHTRAHTHTLRLQVPLRCMPHIHYAYTLAHTPHPQPHLDEPPLHFTHTHTHQGPTWMTPPPPVPALSLNRSGSPHRSASQSIITCAAYGWVHYTAGFIVCFPFGCGITFNKFGPQGLGFRAFGPPRSASRSIITCASFCVETMCGITVWIAITSGGSCSSKVNSSQEAGAHHLQLGSDGGLSNRVKP